MEYLYSAAICIDRKRKRRLKPRVYEYINCEYVENNLSTSFIQL